MSMREEISVALGKGGHIGIGISHQNSGAPLAPGTVSFTVTDGAHQPTELILRTPEARQILKGFLAYISE